MPDRSSLPDSTSKPGIPLKSNKLVPLWLEFARHGPRTVPGNVEGQINIWCDRKQREKPYKLYARPLTFIGLAVSAQSTPSRKPLILPNTVCHAVVSAP